MISSKKVFAVVVTAGFAVGGLLGSVLVLQPRLEGHLVSRDLQQSLDHRAARAARSVSDWLDLAAATVRIDERLAGLSDAEDARSGTIDELARLGTMHGLQAVQVRRVDESGGEGRARHAEFELRGEGGFRAVLDFLDSTTAVPSLAPIRFSIEPANGRIALDVRFRRWSVAPTGPEATDVSGVGSGGDA